jgi:phenylalanyl-tRNA synthetase beta chain
VVEDYPVQTEKLTIDVSADRVNATLGTDNSIEHMLETLKHVEFDTSIVDDVLRTTAPYWRADIHIPEDVIEEIGRINSYDSITPTLAKRDFTAVRPSDFDGLRARIRESLVRAGANEVLTYSFVHGNILEKAGLDPSNSYRITNSISPDLQYYRQSLTPSLLGLIHPNIKQGYEHFAVFELNKTHPKHLGLTDEQVPVEADSLALTIAGKKSAGGSAYYQAKRMLDYLASNLNLELEYRNVESSDDVVAAPFESRHAAVVTDKKTGVVLGIIGEYKKSVARGFKLPDYVAGFELDARSLFTAASAATSDYTPLSRYPGSERDVCFQVANDVSYSQLVSCVQNVLDGVNLEATVSPIDIYQAQGSETKNITLRIKLTAHDRTLSSDEIAEVISQVSSTAESQVAAKIV